MSTPDHGSRPLTATEAPRALATIVMAFSADRAVRFRLLAGPALDDGSAWATGALEGVGLWLRSGAHRDEEALAAHLQATVTAAP